MFVYPQWHSSRRQRIAIALSAAAHLAIVAILGIRPAAVLIVPPLKQQGDHGASVVLYFAPRAEQETLVAEPVKPKPARLYMPRPVKKQYNARSTDMPDAQAHNSDPQTSANAPGTTEGTDPVGMSMGPDVRPAVEITNLTPPVTRSDLAGLDGEVWVEVTIDEQGNVTGIKLLKGLRQAIDDKVIATVWKWHYIPATKNGVAIPSKYDAHFPYHG